MDNCNFEINRHVQVEESTDNYPQCLYFSLQCYMYVLNLYSHAVKRTGYCSLLNSVYGGFESLAAVLGDLVLLNEINEFGQTRINYIA